jgi:hypothetical protein
VSENHKINQNHSIDIDMQDSDLGNEKGTEKTLNLNKL